MKAVSIVNVEKETLILVGIIISLLGLFLAYRQYKEQREIWQLQKELTQHELDKIKHQA